MLAYAARWHLQSSKTALKFNHTLPLQDGVHMNWAYSLHEGQYSKTSLIRTLLIRTLGYYELILKSRPIRNSTPCYFYCVIRTLLKRTLGLYD